MAVLTYCIDSDVARPDSSTAPNNSMRSDLVLGNCAPRPQSNGPRKRRKYHSRSLIRLFAVFPWFHPTVARRCPALSMAIAPPVAPWSVAHRLAVVKRL